ncbi:MAG: hypothetical protein JO115_06550 [Pseudonocardiales bacterium]|nr:hypothetical protein [Pseudonocardiales bacterium]
MAQRFQFTPDAMKVFTRFQREPLDGDLRAAVHGRLTEAMLVDAGFASAIEAALHRAEGGCSAASASQPDFTAQLQGSMRDSTINQGNGTVDQSRRTRISFPMATLALLLGGSAVVGGGGAAIYNATSSDAGSYLYYAASGTGSASGFIVIDWTTQRNGNLIGTMADEDHYLSRTSDADRNTTPFTGHQDGNDVELSVAGYAFLHCTIGLGSLTCQKLGFGTGTYTLHKITPEELERIVSDYRQHHHSVEIGPFRPPRE